MIFSRKDLFNLNKAYIYGFLYRYDITQKNPLIKLFLWTRVIPQNWFEEDVLRCDVHRRILGVVSVRPLTRIFFVKTTSLGSTQEENQTCLTLSITASTTDGSVCF